jgi:3-oxoacyl-[acyl-carrier protein] reductase
MQSHFVIVGGTSGIGLALTNLLLDRGAEITVIARNRRSLPEHDRIRFVQKDVGTEEIKAEDLPATIDGLVYCPGSIVLKPFRSLSEQQFLQDFQINVLGAVKVIKVATAGLKQSAQTPGIVLFSTVAVNQGMPFHASIAAAKGAVEGLTRSLAAEFAPAVRVNCIAPSLTHTPLASALLSTPEKESAAAQRHPMKQIGKPEEIASLAAFLLSDQASWITGQILHADGGMSSLRV